MLTNSIYDRLLKNLYSSYHHPSYSLEKELIMYIKLMDEKKSFEILKQINSLEKATLSEVPLTSMKYSLVGSCTLFTRAIITAGIDSETAFMASDLYINRIDKCATIKQLNNLEYEMITDFINLIKTNKERVYSPLIRKIMFYINQNIDHKITLSDISEYTSLHPNYISSIFKKEAGISISEYINKRKMELIKTFLTESSLTLSEIAFTFGFSSQAHFSCYFKNNSGISPLKYKKLHSLM